MGKLKNSIYPVASAFVLSLPWLFQLPGYLLFAGFVPLLLFEDKFSERHDKSSRFVYLNHMVVAFFLWNLLSAWWLGHATLIGLTLFLFLNTFLMTLIWYLYHRFKQQTNESLALFFLASLWLAFEFLHLNWDMQLPGMTLGGAFGNQVKMVQWYEYTGELGGSLWVLIINILIYKSIRYYRKVRKINIQIAGVLLATVFVPLAFSYYLYYSYSEKGSKVSFLVIQPDIDPYTEKFSEPDSCLQGNILSLIKSSKNKTIIVGPETALPPFREDSAQTVPEIRKLKEKLAQIPGTKLIIGANTIRPLAETEKTTITTRFFPDKTRYEEYNSAVLIDPEGEVRIYHKNILVSGVEKVPFVRYFGFLKNFFFDLGGTAGGLRSGEPVNFSINDTLTISPVICFESMFGEYIGKLVKKGGQLIVVITNDGWWGKSPGAGLHFSYSRLRAIEMRRSIVRSANTGISGFINQRGDVPAKTAICTRATIDAELKTNCFITFYALYGDYMGRVASFFSVMLLLFFISARMKNPKTEEA